MRRWIQTFGLGLVAVLVATPVSAQIVQSVHVGIGGFFPRGFDSREPGDVLVADLTDPSPLDFDLSRFKWATLFGEWNVQVGNHLEVGAGVSYYNRHAPSFYRDLVNADGSDIRQTLGLRVIPVTAVVRFLPFGTPRTAQPYVGVGIASLQWRYTESGQFVASDYSVYTDRYVATGRTVGPVGLVGLRMPIGGDIYALTLEWRYQFGVGNTGGLPAGFLGDKIDLSGGNLNFGFLVRF